MRPVISSLWIGKRLSYIEQLCLKSFADHGHRVKLYSYEEIENIPEGVEAADARKILPDLEVFIHKGRNSPATSADKFRYHLLATTDEIWVDSDAYCTRPFPDSDYIFASDTGKTYANGILRLPRFSPTLHSLIEFCEMEYPILPDDWVYYNADDRRRFTEGGENGEVHISEMFWGVWGPQALTYFLRKNGETNHAWAPNTHYPFSAQKSRGLAVPTISKKLRLPLDTYSIHLYGSSLRDFIIRRPMFKNNIPLKGSFLHQRLIDHEIDPASAPLTRFKVDDN